MSWGSRNAVIDPVTPTITVEVFGLEYPAIPAVAYPALAPNTSAPAWAGGFVHEDAVNGGGLSGGFQFSNYPTLFASAYSSEGLKLDIIGVKVYAFTAGDTFPYRAPTAGYLNEPHNITYFGTGIGYETSGIIASLASTLAEPEAVIFVRVGDNEGFTETDLTGFKVKWDGTYEHVGLFSSPAEDLTDVVGDRVFAAVGVAADNSYYIVHSTGPDSFEYVLTIAAEGVYPVTPVSTTSYFLGFSHADLPASMKTLGGCVRNGSVTYSLVAIHPTDLGFLISYKKKITGVWTQKYILVAHDWTTFQWVEFTAGDAAAQAIIDQSTGDAFGAGPGYALTQTNLVSAYCKNGKWYLLGGTYDTPAVGLSEPDDYVILSDGLTSEAEVGFFTDSPFKPSGGGFIDGAFFGYADLPFDGQTEETDTCAEQVVYARGLSETPTVGDEGCFFRSWTFTLDGHDFYVIRLGCVETLVYDVYAEQWYEYETEASGVWRPVTGINWVGGETVGSPYGSNILVGDDRSGALSFLSPTDADDQLAYLADAAPFERIVQGQLIQKGRNLIPCYGVQLIGSLGDNQSDLLTDVTLEISDDAGHNYVNCGTVTITPDAYNFRAEWLSLGSFGMPGRLFKITDYGALIRIDGLENLDGRNPKP